MWNPERQKYLARRLRNNMTDAEWKLWASLSRDQMGVRFRRQTPIGRYIVDFVCFSPQLIIECDGGQHAIHPEYDKKRDAFLKELNFKVLHFWNHDILSNTDGVLTVIKNTIDEMICSRSARD